ncbi:acyl carrier protein [Aliiruegeria lutimaris]|uniref:Phosphopantetheine attachment site n=1 Tax=Aliiruegeria lutimaris TaxID=571298 RepID=A0A1G8NAV0_9RHOB|nr:phosphopantetheine-binding protein [Aliiruegeria lutimaris]SDI76660.1 Phosphopantetheine attachment site [Aliiruegeria lutimaris]
MADTAQLAEKILEFLRDEIDDEDVALDAQTALFSDGLIDSFAMAGLIEFLEEETGKTIAQSDVVLENFDSIEKIVAFLSQD